MNEKNNNCDVAIIGAAAAGLSAALFSVRRGLKTIVIAKDIGGQLASTVDVENYPGIDYITGYELAQNMAKQAQKHGAEIIIDEVTAITVNSDQDITITTNNSTVTAKALIIALGKTPRSLNVPGEKELFGKGVSHAASVEMPKYVDKTVVIVGGGGSAFEAARLAIKVAKKVILVHRNQSFRAEATVVEEVKQSPKITLLLDSEIEQINGADKVEGVTIKRIANGTDATTADYPCDAVLIEVGFEIKRDLLQGLLALSPQNNIIVDANGATSVPGIYAAGDITDRPHNQAIISAGEGANAALSAFTYITGKPAGADWGQTKN